MAASLIGGQAAVAAQDCIQSSEIEADQIRFVETQLKVASLQCRSFENADLATLYSAFVKENRPYLVRSTRPIKTYLERSGNISVAGHMSEMARRVSFESKKVSQFCNRARLAAQYSAKSPHPSMLLGMLPIRYERPAEMCVG